jgi:hypothetical protein
VGGAEARHEEAEQGGRHIFGSGEGDACAGESEVRIWDLTGGAFAFGVVDFRLEICASGGGEVV